MSDARYLLSTVVVCPQSGLKAVVTVADCRNLTDEGRLELMTRIDQAVSHVLTYSMTRDPLYGSKSAGKPLWKQFGGGVRS